jgi:hypothetical protein
MDPATLAVAALTILTPFAKDTGKELVKTVGEIGAGKAKDLFTWLKERFAGDPAAAKDVSRFAAEPDKFEPSLESTIKEKAEQDPEFASQLKKRIDEIGPQIKVFMEIKNARNVIGVDADKIRSGNVEVTQKAEEADGMIGVRARELG